MSYTTIVSNVHGLQNYATWIELGETSMAGRMAVIKKYMTFKNFFCV